MLFLVNKFRGGDVLYGIKILLLLLPHDSIGSACKMKKNNSAHLQRGICHISDSFPFNAALITLRDVWQQGFAFVFLFIMCTLIKILRKISPCVGICSALVWKWWSLCCVPENAPWFRGQKWSADAIPHTWPCLLSTPLINSSNCLHWFPLLFSVVESRVILIRQAQSHIR